MAGKTAKGEISRDNLIEAAGRVFQRQGFAETTVRHIANEAGVALGGLYRHFTSKDEFIAIVLAEGMRDINRQVREAVEACPPGTAFRSILKAAIKAQVTATRQKGTSFDLAVRYERLEGKQDSVWRPYQDEVARYRKFWREMIATAQRDGVLRQDAQATLLNFFLLGAVTWVSQWYRPGRRSVDSIAEDFTDFFLNGSRHP